MNVETLLHDVIRSGLADLDGDYLKGEERRAKVDELTKLMDRAIEMEKVGMEAEDKAATREIDKQFKEQQMSEDRKDRLVKNILSGLGIVLPIGLTVWGTKKTFKFEETGTITSAMGRGFINKLFPKK